MEEEIAKKYALKIKKLPQSQLEIAVAIPTEEFDAARAEAIRHIGADVEFPGFRKGHVPESILVTKVGETAILEEMAEIAISRVYPEIIRAEKLDVLGRPDVRITKIARGNPLEFTLTTAVLPEFTLPDYKKIAGKTARTTDDVLVSDDEVEKAVEQIRSMRAKNETAPSDEKMSAPPPPLDDAYVKTLGDFAGVEDFKVKLRENMQREKERAAKDKRRVAIIDAVLAKTMIELPEVIVLQELLRMKDEFAHDVKQMGLSMADYLKAIKKTEEEMEKEWRPTAEKRAKTQLVVGKIAESEHLGPDEETVKKEVAALKRRYPDAPDDRALGYVHMLLTNEKVFELLESQEA